jgi:transposase-like protein
MDTHKNASLTPKGREAMVRSVIEGGARKAATARQFNTTAETIGKWVNVSAQKTSTDCAIAPQAPFIAKPNPACHVRRKIEISATLRASYRRRPVGGFARRHFDGRPDVALILGEFEQFSHPELLGFLFVP